MPSDFDVLAGDDVFRSPLLALGAVGGILASAHLATARFTELVTAGDAATLPMQAPLDIGWRDCRPPRSPNPIRR